MAELLLTILSFVVVLGILVAVHEYGHFWVARKLGVKVLRYSIGFGKPLYSFHGKVDNTEYVVAAIPLGGYVKMVDEREGDVAAADLPRAFNRQSLPVRAAIVVAGPLVNILFAIAAYWLMFMNGVEGTLAVVDTPKEATPASYAGLQAGDIITAVAEQQTPSWQAVVEELLPAALNRQQVEVTISRHGITQQHSIDFQQATVEMDGDNFFELSGLQPQRLTIDPIIDEVVAASAAADAGLQSMDRVVAINGEEISSWQQMVHIVQANPDTELEMIVLRDGEELVRYVTPSRVDDGSSSKGKLGVSAYIDPQMLEDHQVIWQYDPMDAMVAAVQKSWNMSVLTLQMIGKMITGSVSVENLSGPITIARYAKKSAQAGISQALGFMAIVSLSLGILNLLPIPVLDGGHLLLFAIEAVSGKPLSEQSEQLMQQFGIAVIAMLSFVAIYNDIMRLGS